MAGPLVNHDAAAQKPATPEAPRAAVAVRVGNEPDPKFNSAITALIKPIAHAREATAAEVEAVLGAVAGGAAQGRLKQIEQQIARSIDAQGQRTPAIEKQIDRLTRLQRELKKRASTIDAAIVRLIGPENSTPEQQVLGHDLQRHLLTRQINELEKQRTSLPDGSEKTEMEANIRSLKEKKAESEKRKEIIVTGGVDANGSKVEPHPELKGVDMVIECASELAKKVNGGAISPETAVKITEDPLGYMEGALLKAVDTPDQMRALVAAKVLTEEQAKELSDLVKMTAEEQDIIGKERADKLKSAGCGGLAFLLVMLYASKQKKDAARMQQ